MLEDELRRLLQSVATGQHPPEEALHLLLASMRSPRPDIAGVTLDLDRAARCGRPEVIYGPGKSPEQIVEIFRELQKAGQACLATRVDASQAAAVRQAFPDVRHNVLARTLRLPVGARTPTATAVLSAPLPAEPEDSVPSVLIVTAGSSDRAVAEEARETLLWLETPCALIADVGVAGPQRLLQHLPQLRSAEVIIVVAGMEGALPSVVGGWVACPVIAVPTSQGYGAAFGGVAALLGMLNSCSANVAVVNIDAGFKAGYLAGMMATQRGA